MTKPKTDRSRTKPDNPDQYRRFIETARELGADESPDAMDRAFERVVMPTKPEPPAAPICCSLEGGEYRERIAWIAALNRDALVSDAREGRRLELVYSPEAADRVAAMVRREKACCPFLTFDFRSGKHQTKLVITAPPEAEDSDALFTAFRSRG